MLKSSCNRIRSFSSGIGPRESRAHRPHAEPSQHQSASNQDAEVRSELKRRLSLAITSLNASVLPRPTEVDQAMSIIDELCRFNPTVTGTASSPLLDGSWILLWTGKARGMNTRGTRLREGSEAGLAAFPWIQEASDAAYSFFYKSFPLLAGSAVGVKGSSSGLRAKGNIQTFDLRQQTVTNEARFEAVGQDCSIKVGGTISSVGSESPNKIRATFTNGRITAGLFSIEVPIGIISPVGFVDTPYLDDEFRISVGDKGSVFVARRIKSGPAS
jgi:hypothetical protein